MSSSYCQSNQVDVLTASDTIQVRPSQYGDSRTASMTAVAAFVQSTITTSDNKTTQYAAPSATGFSVSIGGSGASVWLVLTPLATYATGTIVLPAVATVVDKQELLVNTTQIVTALTITPNGATVTGAPTTLAANAFFTLRFEAVTKTWYRVN